MQGVTVVDHPLVQHKLTIMRNKETSTAGFRRLLREISLLLGYEVTRDLELTTTTIETPLETMEARRISGKKVAVNPVLRAGIGMLEGVLSLISSARVGFIGLYRDEETLRPVPYYNRTLGSGRAGRVLVVDPMLATGGSAVSAISLVKEVGAARITYIGLVAAPYGVVRLADAHPDVDIHVATLDRELNELGYICPGLGDAGDRVFHTGE